MTRRFLPSLAMALLTAGCGSAAGTSAPTTAAVATATVAPSAAATATPAPTAVVVPIRLDETLTLADGRKIKARCVGEGSPTVLLEVGGSNDMSEWQPQFVNDLGAVTTTCLYSRAGGRGSSDPAIRPVSMAAVTSDAYEVLALAKAKAGVTGPYVFVGWSLGGSVALADALARPDETVGIAIFDTDFPQDSIKACVADGRMTLAECTADYEGDIDARFMEKQVNHAVHPLDIPAVLVTAMAYPDCADSPSATLSANVGGTTLIAADCAGLAGLIADKQIADWRAALPQIEQTRVDADHDGLIRSVGRQLVELLRPIIEGARVST